MSEAYVWELRSPDGGMLGMEFARGMSAPTDVLLVHAAPERLDVEVRTTDGALVARGEALRHDAVTPMSRLSISGSEVRRVNVWPEESDLGRPVILAGGEVGVLTAWWNDEPGQEWRWSIELHNRADKPLKR